MAKPLSLDTSQLPFSITIKCKTVKIYTSSLVNALGQLKITKYSLNSIHTILHELVNINS